MKYQQRSTKCQQNGTLLTILMAMLLVVLLLFAIACEPALIIEVENQTEQTLIIYNDGRQIGEVAPDETAKMDAGANVGAFIEARHSEGEVVYAKEFTRSELYHARYKIVISPSSE
jgi:hypothetical protein